MINLIPNTEKKMMIRDFYLRLVVIVFLALGSVAVIASIVLFPSYFLSSVKKDLISEKLDKELAEPIDEISKQTLSAIEDLDKKLSLLEKAEKKKFSVSERIINEILSKKISGIKITEISFTNDSTKGMQVSIRGLAPSRERLLLFRLALENDPLFKKVDLPISNFVQGSNIRFYLSLMPS